MTDKIYEWHTALSLNRRLRQLIPRTTLLGWIGEKKLKTYSHTVAAILSAEGEKRLGQGWGCGEQPSLPTLSQAVIGIACGRFFEYNFLMSLHRSLSSGAATASKRNVLKRFERVTLLK
jgi:hypothetical protein